MITSNAQLLKKLPSWIYKAGAQAWTDTTYPRHLFIETTATCNLTCTYCPRQRIHGNMDFQLFKEVVDEASKYGARSFSLHLFGEPLLYPSYAEAITYIKRKNARHTVLLTTNGTKLNECIDHLKDASPDKVLWSWRKEAKFSEETKKKLKAWKAFTVRIIKEVTPPEALEEYSTWRNVEYRSLHNYGGNININSFQKQSSGSAETSSVTSQEERWPCYHLWLAPAVAWNGNILICCSDPHQKEVLGQFPHQTVHEVWTGDKLKAIRDSHLKGEYGGICTNCDVWKQYKDIFFSWQRIT